jgi:uncharacterized protein YndB with AHSA1/START domain
MDARIHQGAAMSDNSQPRSDVTTTDLVVRRLIDAPIEAVWKAWSDPDLIRQWWGPVGFTCPVANVDFREGGTTLVCMSSPEYGDIYNTWTYRRITPMQRIEFDSRFADADGKTVKPAAFGIPPEVPDPVPHVVTLEAYGDQRTTLLTVTEHGYTAGPALEMSKFGQEQCVDKLAAAVASSPS